MVQMIFALRFCWGSARHADCALEVLSLMKVQLGAVIVPGQRVNGFHSNRSYGVPPTAVSSLPNVDLGNSIALNSAPMRITSEMRYIHTSRAMATPSDP